MVTKSVMERTKGPTAGIGVGDGSDCLDCRKWLAWEGRDVSETRRVCQQHVKAI